MFKNWDELKTYQETVYRILLNSIRYNRLSHSYIFSGPRGTKKEDTAILLAKSLLCLEPIGEDPCNKCHNCLRIDTLNHPNVFFIKPNTKVIKKETVISLIQEFSKAALEKGPRIYIIVHADRFNQSSANTLLKTMEEPGQDIYQILITENFNGLLSTIISRAETISFKPIDRDLVKEHLLANAIEDKIANIISQYTVDILAAEKYAKDKDMIRIIELVEEIFIGLLQKDSSSIIAFYNNMNVVVNDNEKIDFFLTLLIIYQRDIINIKLKKEERIVFSNNTETLVKLAKKIRLSQAQGFLDEMLELTRRIEYNININLAFNRLLMSMERGYKHATHSRSDTI
jgi:DNA polymerase-3 subunit delta'